MPKGAALTTIAHGGCPAAARLRGTAARDSARSDIRPSLEFGP